MCFWHMVQQHTRRLYVNQDGKLHTNEANHYFIEKIEESIYRSRAATSAARRKFIFFLYFIEQHKSPLSQFPGGGKQRVDDEGGGKKERAREREKINHHRI